MENSLPCNGFSFTDILESNEPAAIACIKGNKDYSELCGIACFYETPLNGILVSVEVYGLPDIKADDNTPHYNVDTISNFYGMHLHEFGNCTPPFDKTGNHYNPGNHEHPYHAGDMPPLMGNNGYAWMVFYDARINIKDVIDKSIVIHRMRDNFTSQPSGDSGDKIGCGVIYGIRNQ